MNILKTDYVQSLSSRFVTGLKPEIERLNYSKIVTGDCLIARPPNTFWTFRIKVERDPGKTDDDSLINKTIASSFWSLHTGMYKIRESFEEGTGSNCKQK